MPGTCPVEGVGWGGGWGKAVLELTATWNGEMSQIARIYFRLARILLASHKDDFRMTNRNSSSGREPLHSR